jgi:DNA-binding NtrC family response regulator
MRADVMTHADSHAARLARVLVVEDDRGLCSAIARIASQWAEEVLEAHDAEVACRMLVRCPPRLVILDVRLPDGSAFDVLDAARVLRPAPAFVAVSGQATPEEAFRLARAGVRAYVAKPFTPEKLHDEVARALGEAPALAPFVSAAVGHRKLRDLQDEVRRTMIDEALALGDGSRSQTARLLGVSRQAVQQIVRHRGRNGASCDDPDRPEEEIA